MGTRITIALLKRNLGDFAEVADAASQAVLHPVTGAPAYEGDFAGLSETHARQLRKWGKRVEGALERALLEIGEPW